MKINVIPYGLEKYMTFFLSKNFIDSMQFMNSSLDKLAKNLSDKDFKYLVEEFGSETLEILKQKGTYPYECVNNFERFNEKNYLLENISLVQQKKGKIDNDGKISDGHVSIKDYLMCEKIWDKFEMKNMGDYHDHYLKENVL